jgi:hypothetical protein
MKYVFPGTMMKGEEVIGIYKKSEEIFIRHFGEVLDRTDNLLIENWDSLQPEGEKINAFYRDNILVPMELIEWHKKNGYKRISRPLMAGAIAVHHQCRTFCEYGAGVGTDSVALAKHGMVCKWTSEINLQNMAIQRELFDFYQMPCVIYDVMGEDLIKNINEDKPDLLYCSDVFEHIDHLEEFLCQWIKGFKMVIVYAPFGMNGRQHQHTSYRKERFVSFMITQGYVPMVYNLAIPPYVYADRRYFYEDIR